ncbi:HD domain-containing protein [Sporolactobacillus laevolacticus]|uniref:HD domain-containing protein n=1 Tax=Sporolactobacillus laevolacticus TaxID=33018 RepID=UPI0025B6151A|nr:HD domain-containing protein [Sporolactobacillus laevolacticus]MDN3954540.1 HD domain-containing protein [Sporolactobacillus laevolacticus]
MNRISIVQHYVDKIIENIKSETERKSAIIHTYGVAQCCALIASRRGLNTELAYISGLLHDIYAFFTGSSLCHAQSGAEMARPAIRNMNIFSDEEKKCILSAIFYHSNKEVVHDEYDEVLKDADLLQRFLTDTVSLINERAIPRLNKLLNEFDIEAASIDYGQNQETAAEPFKKSLFADIAEKFAGQNICGERENKTFIEIIKYYPEASAFDELRNNWCAAFVYHCALKAGMELPIKQPPIEYRFAGAGAWYEWGKANGFISHDNGGFIPARGDIVIFNHIISPENKPKDSAWHDHIGIVLACEDAFLVTAEGNIDNQNVSGIVKRRRDHTIGCFLRIPDGYQYDGWKCDYKASRIYTL